MRHNLRPGDEADEDVVSIYLKVMSCTQQIHERDLLGGGGDIEKGKRERHGRRSSGK